MIKYNNYIFIGVILLVVGILFYWTHQGGLREGMTSIPYGCTIKKCSRENGCIPPTGIDGNCDEYIYKDKNGKMFKKCYYECSEPLDKCAYDECCKAVCPPVYFRYSSSVPVHPSMIIHTDDVIVAGDSGSSSSSSSSSSTYIPTSRYEPAMPSKNITENTQGTPMPEYDPDQQTVANSSARFPTRTKSESERRNQAFMEGDMTKVNTQNITTNDNHVKPYEYQRDSGYVMNVDVPVDTSVPKGYTDVFLP